VTGRGRLDLADVAHAPLWVLAAQRRVERGVALGRVRPAALVGTVENEQPAGLFPRRSEPDL
jgi:hypothetical protein